MTTKERDLRAKIKEAKTRKTLRLASVATLRNKKPVEAARQAAEARREEIIISRLEENLRELT